MDGQYDYLPEMAFNLVGNMAQAIEKGEKMMAEAKGQLTMCQSANLKMITFSNLHIDQSSNYSYAFS
jgi:hypothetical protein